MLTEEAVSKQIGTAPRPAQPPGDGVMVVLFFSGGGTRAAAFSYGVLRELSQTIVPASQPQRRLLDDVQVVAAVSGGSFTAAYYCLYHDRIFRDFESRFLKKNIQAALIMQMFMTWPKLMSPYYGRSDMAADYYDRHLFDGAKFGDLARAGGRPYLAINATDLATGEHFAFTNTRFSLIASNRDDFPIARAVAASSAIPFILTPVTLKNYAGMPGAAKPRFALRPPGAETQISYRESQILRILNSYADSKNKPYLHLVDGGFADNLGLQGIIDDAVAFGGISRLIEWSGVQQPKRLVIIIVNSAAKRGDEWNEREAVPGALTSMLEVGDRSGERSDHQMIEEVRDGLKAWKKSEREAHQTTGDAPDYYLIDIGFDAITNASERSFFLNLMTTFWLPDKTIDRLVDAGGKILHDSPEYGRLLEDMKKDRQAR